MNRFLYGYDVIDLMVLMFYKSKNIENQSNEQYCHNQKSRKKITKIDRYTQYVIPFQIHNIEQCSDAAIYSKERFPIKKIRENNKPNNQYPMQFVRKMFNEIKV